VGTILNAYLCSITLKQYIMECTLENLERVFKMIIEQHADNNEHAEFDDESDLVDVVKRVVNQLDEEPTFCCQNCGGGFMREEMVFGDDVDLCKDCAK
jgi:formylmethanofuran dehydrogenase subunit E